MTKLDNRLGLRRTDASRVDGRQIRFGLFEGIGPLSPYPPRQATAPDYAFAERMSWWVFLSPITQRSNGKGLRMSDTAFADTARVIPTREDQAPERLLSETEVFTQGAWDAGLEPHHSTMPTLRPKLRKVARRSFSMAMAFDCNSLRWVSSIRSFWLRSVLTCTGRYIPTRII